VIDMSGWESISRVTDRPVALTREEVRALLEEGRIARADIERRIARMERPHHAYREGSGFYCDRCGVARNGAAAREQCIGYRAT